MSARLKLAVLLACLSMASAEPQPVRSDDALPAADKESVAPIRFRRVYAPADRLEEWPFGGAKYVPVEATEFESRLDAVRAATPGDAVSAGSPGKASAHCTSALYEARLEGHRLVSGLATLHVDHAARLPVLLSLEPCNLAIGKANWKEIASIDEEPTAEEPTAEESVEARLGTGVDGQLAVLVAGSGDLSFDWSLAGEQTVSETAGVSETVSFRLELPHCPAKRLFLDIPQNLVPTIDEGIVLPAGDVDGDGKFRRWQIELGGRSRFDLRIVPADAADRRPQLAMVRESVVYDFSLSGVNVAAELRLEVHDEPLRQVRLALDPPLQLVTAKCGDTTIPWSVLPSDEGAASRVLLTLPDSVSDTECVLQLGAVAPLTMDRQWRLPRIRSEGLFWQEGDAYLLVPAPLVIDRLVPIGCRQTGTGSLSTPRVGETAQFQFYTPDGTVDIVLSRRKPVLRMLGGTVVELGEAEMTASVRAKFTTLQGERFSIEADVAQQWLIDSVESLPPEALDDWTLDKPAGNQRTLTVRLTKGVSPDRSILLLIAARKLQSPLGRKLGLSDILPLKFRLPSQSAQAQSKQARSEQLVAVDAVGPYRVTLQGAERLNHVSPHDLDAAQRELFAELPRNVLFQNDIDAADLQLTLESQTPSYEGKIRVEAVVRDGRLRESYTLRCLPESSQRVQRVLVHFSHRRDVPIQWTLGADDGRQLVARQLSVDEQAAVGLPAEEETWELTLVRPRNVDFEIHATRDLVSADQRRISLASLPEATSQQGVLVVRSFGRDAVVIQNRGLKPIPSETVPPNRYQTVRATYRYAPADLTATSEVAATIATSHDSNTPSAWIWDCHLESRYETGGDSRHLAVYRLQSCAAGQMQLTLPAAVRAADVRGVWVNERRVDRVAADPEARKVTVDLPETERFPTVSIDFTMPRTRLGIVGSLSPPLPLPDLPILSRHWTVWLPPGYETYDPDPRWQSLRSAPPTWRQRLFSEIARGEGQTPFDPTVPHHWSLSASDPSSRRDGLRRAQQLLQTLGELASGNIPASEHAAINGGVDWATLLSHEAVASQQLTLLIDRHAMAQMSIRPSTSVRPGVGETASARGVSLLQRNRLALLVHREVLLLTTQADAALYRTHLSSLGSHGLWWVRPGPLADQLEHSAGSTQEGTLVSIDRWKRRPARQKVFWTRAVLAGREAADMHGWSAYRLETPGSAAVRLKFVHRKSLRLFGSVTFLLVTALGWWIGRRHVFVLIVSGGVFGLTAMLLPAAYIPVASGAVLATLFCLTLRLVQSANAPEASDVDASQDSAPSATGSVARKIGAGKIGAGKIGTVALVVAMLWGLVGAACGQERGTTSPMPALPIHRVFIPIDKNEQPVGDKVYVPAELYNTLFRRAAATTENPQGWLITGATYRGRLSRSTVSGQLVVDRLLASFKLLVFDHTRRIRIPLGRRGANLLPDGAMLDGQVVRPEWESGGEALLIEVPQPGQYDLELTLQPTMRMVGALSQFDLSIPRLATSRLELDFPPGTPPVVELPQTAGNIRFEGEPSRMLADLGPCDRLTVRFSDGRTTSNGSAVDVESLLWLHVQPGSVVVDTKFKIKVVEGHIRGIQLVTDPRMRLLPLQGENPPTAQIESTPGEPQRITLQWPEPIAEETVVHAKFLLTGTSGVGNLRLPAMDVLDARLTRRWMAVSVDPALDHQEQGNEDLDRVPVSDFEDHWGETTMKPQFAYRLGVEETGWSLATWPREPHTVIDQELTISLALDRADIQFDAQLVNTAGYYFQHRLIVPPALQIEHLSVFEEGVRRVARWSKDEKGHVTVFLTGPVDNRQELSLQGWIPIASKKRWNLPTIRIDHGQWKPAAIDVQSSVIKVFRQPAVRVKIQLQSGLIPVEDATPAPEDRELGRLVGWFRAEPTKPVRASLTLSPNRPQVQADQITRVRKTDTSWIAEVDCHLRVTGGIVDEIRLNIPNSFSGPYRITGDPTAELRVVDGPDEIRQLVVRPTMPIEAEYRFVISGPFDVAPNGRCRVPRIELQQVDSLRRTVALPTQADGRPITWETSALRELPSPDETATSRDATTFTLYEVLPSVFEGGAFEATAAATNQTGHAARVRLADLRIDWEVDGTCQGVATFDLEPGKMRQCPLWLPDGINLIHVSVAGIPTEPEPAGERGWQIRLGPEGLPQRIEVVFNGTLPEPSSATARRFEAPSLGELAVERTLWTVTGPSLLGPGIPAADTRVGPYRHDLIRLKNVAAMIESASARSVEDPEDMIRWYQLWVTRFASARSTLRRELAAAPNGQSTEEVEAELSKIDRQQARIAERMETTALLAQVSGAEAVADDPGELWRWWSKSARTATRCLVEGSSDPLTLTYRTTQPGGLRYRLASAGGLMLFVLAVAIGFQRGTLAAWFRSWPGTFGVVVGLAWWLWLSPSILGWGIVAASLIASMLPGWKHAQPTNGSAIVTVHSRQR